MPVIIIGVILLGSIILLDKFAFGEFGISQPIMVGTIFGAIFGDIQSGILVGAGLQLIFLGGLPIGRDIPPDGQAAGIIGCSSFFIMRTAYPLGQSLFLALFFALIASVCGGVLEIAARRLNDRLSSGYRKRVQRLALYHLSGLITAFGRGICIITPFVLIASLVPIPAQCPGINPSMFLIITTGIGLAHALYLFIKRSTILYMIIGGLCGLALLVL